MTEREVSEITVEMNDAWPDYEPTAEEMDAAHKAHLASVEAEFQKTRDLLLTDDKALAFWTRHRGEA